MIKIKSIFNESKFGTNECCDDGNFYHNENLENQIDFIYYTFIKVENYIYVVAITNNKDNELGMKEVSYLRMSEHWKMDHSRGQVEVLVDESEGFSFDNIMWIKELFSKMTHATIGMQVTEGIGCLIFTAGSDKLKKTYENIIKHYWKRLRYTHKDIFSEDDVTFASIKVKQKEYFTITLKKQ